MYHLGTPRALECSPVCELFVQEITLDATLNAISCTWERPVSEFFGANKALYETEALYQDNGSSNGIL